MWFEVLKKKKDACYHKVKSRYKKWPSAYASGALVQCRKVGAKNWGESTKKSWQDISKRLEMNTEDFCCAELKREADEFMRDLGEVQNDPTLEPKYSKRFQYSGCKQILRHINFLTSSSNLPEGFKERLVQMIDTYEDCKRFPNKIVRG